MQIIKANEQSRNAIIALLKKYNLPTGDLPSSLADFYTALDGDQLAGLIGMEQYGRCGLLRSMVVDDAYRNQNIAGTLVTMLEEAAKSSGIETMYLLTETADQYFSRKGYNTVSRDEVPAEIKTSSEFSHVCPASAVVMKKQLVEQTVAV
jgi:amino-acid N-acetyltransferase